MRCAEGHFIYLWASTCTSCQWLTHIFRCLRTQQRPISTLRINGRGRGMTLYTHVSYNLISLPANGVPANHNSAIVTSPLRWRKVETRVQAPQVLETMRRCHPVHNDNSGLWTLESFHLAADVGTEVHQLWQRPGYSQFIRSEGPK